MKRSRRIPRWLPLAGCVLLVVLEALPWGVVLRFANPEGPPFRHTYAYFDPTPYGYAHFSPFLTALLPVVLLVLAFVALWRDSPRLRATQKILCVAALVLSLLPLCRGLAYVTFLGGAITLLLAALALYYLRR